MNCCYHQLVTSSSLLFKMSTCFMGCPFKGSGLYTELYYCVCALLSVHSQSATSMCWCGKNRANWFSVFMKSKHIVFNQKRLEVIADQSATLLNILCIVVYVKSLLNHTWIIHQNAVKYFNLIKFGLCVPVNQDLTIFHPGRNTNGASTKGACLILFE